MRQVNIWRGFSFFSRTMLATCGHLKYIIEFIMYVTLPSSEAGLARLHTSIDKAPEVDDKKPFLVRRAHIIMRKEKSRRQAAKTNKLKKRKVEHFLEITEISIITPARPKRPALYGHTGAI